MSWLFTSASGPRLVRMSYIQGLGVVGPCVSDLTSTTRPISPASTRCLAATNPASNRRMKPICSLTRAASAAAIISSHSPGVGRHRLFAQDVLAGLRGRDDDRPVKRGRSRHDDRVDPRIGQGLGVVGVGRVQLQFLAGLLAGLRHRFDQGDQARAARCGQPQNSGRGSCPLVHCR